MYRAAFGSFAMYPAVGLNVAKALKGARTDEGSSGPGSNRSGSAAHAVCERVRA